jgi:hypothetical protein
MGRRKKNERAREGEKVGGGLHQKRKRGEKKREERRDGEKTKE